MRRSLFFCSFLLVLLAAFASATAAADEEVVLVQVTHRHGARTPIINSPTLEKMICGTAGCGELTHNGKMMLTALGNFLHDRYGNPATSTVNGHPAVKASSDFAVFADGRYHMRRLTSRSTDIDRTIQSADGLIRGIVQNLTDFYPVIHTVATDRDTLILTDTALSMVIPFETKKLACINDIDTKKLGEMFVQPADLAAIAEELGMAANLPCSNLNATSTTIYDWMNCTLNLQDATASFQAMYSDVATRYPKAIAAFGKMSDFLQFIRVCKYATTTAKQGYLSYLLVDTMVSNMKNRIAQLKSTPVGEAGEHETLIYEYSGHDTTVAPLAVALGHKSLLLPKFGQAIITELVRDKSKKVDDMSAYSIRHWYGQPKTMEPPSGRNSEPSDYSYHFDPLSVVCAELKVSPASTSTSTTTTLTPDDVTIKNVTDGSCTLEQFAWYTQAILAPSDPKDGGAACYLSDDIRKDIDCNTAPTPPAGSQCEKFRQRCPANGCPPDFAVNQQTLQCVSLKFVPAVSLGQAWAMASGTTVAGGVLGVALTFIVKALMVPEVTD